MTRILHITAYHFSISTGGTETYIENLEKSLVRIFNAVNHVGVFLPRPMSKPLASTADVTYLFAKDSSNSGLATFHEQCKQLLDHVNPDYVIFHTVDNYEGIIVDDLLSRNIPFAFILHAACWICYQENRYFNCKKPCDKMFSPLSCAICSWHKPSNLLIQLIKFAGREILGFLGRESIQRYNHLKKDIFFKAKVVKNATACIVLNDRDFAYFQRNGIPENRLHIIRTGITEDVLDVCRHNAQKNREGILKILCIGRFSHVKGSNILVEAAHSLPKDFDFQLDFYGYRDINDKYVQDGLKLADNDPRIRINPLLPHKELLHKYADYDIQCLPSPIFDNGPMVVWEGAYSGCRLATSEFLGQKDFVAQYGDIITPNDVEHWAKHIKYCVDNIELIRNHRVCEFPEYSSMDNIAQQIIKYLASPVLH